MVVHWQQWVYKLYKSKRTLSSPNLRPCTEDLSSNIIYKQNVLFLPVKINVGDFTHVCQTTDTDVTLLHSVSMSNAINVLSLAEKGEGKKILTFGRNCVRFPLVSTREKEGLSEVFIGLQFLIYGAKDCFLLALLLLVFNQFNLLRFGACAWEGKSSLH